MQIKLFFLLLFAVLFAFIAASVAIVYVCLILKSQFIDIDHSQIFVYFGKSKLVQIMLMAIGTKQESQSSNYLLNIILYPLILLNRHNQI